MYDPGQTAEPIKAVTSWYIDINYNYETISHKLNWSLPTLP